MNVRLALFSILIISPVALGYPEDDVPEARRKALELQTKLSCESTDEYIKTIKFIRTNPDLMIPEAASRMIADRVSKGCTGAFERFSKTLLLLKKVGISDAKSLEMALEFAAVSTDTHRNFMEIFTRAFLAEFFDYDYVSAVKLAYELSKDYKGDPVQVRDDFIELVRFCKDSKNLDLPIRLCSEYTVKLAKLSQYYTDGVRQHFYKLYNHLREKKPFEMDIKNALDVTYNVLKGGPKAPDNFFKGYEFATKEEGLNYGHRQAMEFALKMANRSYLGETPTVIPGFIVEAEDVMRAISSTKNR